MKRILFLNTILLASVALSAQDVFDLMRYASTDITGTARYMSMGGAFGALGGDVSAISDNPAGLGIYRSSEVTLSADFLSTVAHTSMDGNAQRANNYNFTVNNAAFVWSFIDKEKTSGWVANNISFSYNRLKTFDRTLSITGGKSPHSMTDFMAGFSFDLLEEDLQVYGDYDPYNNINIPFLSELAYQGYLINLDTLGNWMSLLNEGELSQARYKAIESGSINEYAFSYGANIGNVVYWGATFGLQTIDYLLQSVYGEDFLGADGSFELKNTLKTSGVGWGFKFGVIARPTSFLRLGLAVHTPTFYTLTDRHYASLNYDVEQVGKTETVKQVGKTETPTASAQYHFCSPLRMQASVAFVIGKSALVSFDYQLSANKQTMKIYYDKSLMSLGDDAYSDVMEEIGQYAKLGHLFKAGAEYRFPNNFAIRGGFAYSMPMLDSEAKKSVPLNTTRTDMEFFKEGAMWYGSVGFGYRGQKGFGVDVAYAYRQRALTYTPYAGCESSADIQSHAHNAVVTLSYRF